MRPPVSPETLAKIDAALDRAECVVLLAVLATEVWLILTGP